MAASYRLTTRSTFEEYSTMAKSTVSKDAIRCAMTDEQYHNVTYTLDVANSLLQVIRPNIDLDTNEDACIALGVVEEKIKQAQGLMEAAWDRTRAARHA